MRIGLAHHYGWAIAVTATDDHEVVDRRRIELLDDPDLPRAPVHHAGGAWEEHTDGEPPTDEELAELVAHVRASAERAASASLDELAAAVGGPITSASIVDWDDDFPTDIAVVRRVPYESRADSVMYRQVLAEAAALRGWTLHRYDPKRVLTEAAARLGDRADDVIEGPRRRLGAPWTKDHKLALAATVVAPAPQL